MNPGESAADPAPPRKRRIDASSSIFRQVRGVVADRKAFHDDPDAAKHKLARWQSSQRKASAPAAASLNASSSWQDLEGLGRPRVSDGHVAAFVAGVLFHYDGRLAESNTLLRSLLDTPLNDQARLYIYLGMNAFDLGDAKTGLALVDQAALQRALRGSHQGTEPPGLGMPPKRPRRPGVPRPDRTGEGSRRLPLLHPLLGLLGIVGQRACEVLLGLAIACILLLKPKVLESNELCRVDLLQPQRMRGQGRAAERGRCAAAVH